MDEPRRAAEEADTWGIARIEISLSTCDIQGRNLDDLWESKSFDAVSCPTLLETGNYSKYSFTKTLASTVPVPLECKFLIDKPTKDNMYISNPLRTCASIRCRD